ncbi:MAG: hypothetical protein MJ123_01075 [Lachnospiraceae bacterium]|nr:hypothetical protein [Lachnospiraceae bacterium]
MMERKLAIFGGGNEAAKYYTDNMVVNIRREKLDTLRKFISDGKRILLIDSNVFFPSFKERLSEHLESQHAKDDFIIIESDSPIYDTAVRLYNCYEYDNNIRLLTNSSGYASLVNYYLTGIITEKQLIEMIVHGL